MISRAAHAAEGADGRDTGGVRVPGWERIRWLRHGFSTRGGGVSEVYGRDDLNLGWTREDTAEAIRENRRRFVLGSAGPGMRLVTLGQIHSERVYVIRSADELLATVDGRAVLEGDGLITDVPGLLLGVGTADCVPVLVVDERRRAVAAFHAGWRGTAARIVENGIALMAEVYGSRAEDLLAAVGPSIGPCCYAVGAEVRSRFEADFAYADSLFQERMPDGQDGREAVRGVGASEAVLNLWEANRRQLIEAGVPAERVTVVGECTACSRTHDGRRRYFSHRAEKGVTGRMLSVIGMVEAAPR